MPLRFSNLLPGIVYILQRCLLPKLIFTFNLSKPHSAVSSATESWDCPFNIYITIIHLSPPITPSHHPPHHPTPITGNHKEESAYLSYAAAAAVRAEPPDHVGTTKWYRGARQSSVPRTDRETFNGFIADAGGRGVMN